MTITEILGLIATALSILGGGYAWLKRLDIREENEKEHKALTDRLNNGEDKFENIEAKLSDLQIKINNLTHEVADNKNTYLTLIQSFAKVTDKIEMILIDNAKIKQKLGIE